MIYRLRAILNATEDVFRDIEIEDNSTLEDLHNVITQSFQLQGDEMASFYTSDEDWNQGEEYCLFDMSEGAAPLKKMQDTAMSEVMDKNNTRLIYIYDFLNMWTFMLELADIAGPVDGTAYPQVIFEMGTLPDSPPDPEFEADPRFAEDDDDDEYGDDEEFYEDYDDNEFY
ncbi:MULTISPECIES: IS1096 element passenger TnpR family protein [Nonlabens]|uniref:Plasmid pRiA4b Orf3-like domain-containing protein n=1 Tax=Nonlabens agnitus TaxID=870484 RepID=A0A2S9WTZ6_9FLAO|nr:MULTISPECIES: hypothetical protein [Nonlabens]KQC33903.1 hypothetical protein AAU57_11605 [Nonlabens sp. YIK11]PRP66806.1 hypothetical protein BST86_06670 [Nonlabens agnitus]